MKYYHILTVLTLTIFASCDPVHQVSLENKTNNKIEVIYFPNLDDQQLGINKPTEITHRGQKMNKLFLDSAETIRIGMVCAHYIPTAEDIALDYLEVRFGRDTMKLIGKNAILTSIQKVSNLDWRMIVR